MGPVVAHDIFAIRGLHWKVLISLQHLTAVRVLLFFMTLMPIMLFGGKFPSLCINDQLGDVSFLFLLMVLMLILLFIGKF